jgi:hypothetical protein
MVRKLGIVLLHRIVRALRRNNMMRDRHSWCESTTLTGQRNSPSDTARPPIPTAPRWRRLGLLEVQLSAVFGIPLTLLSTDLP